MAVVEKGPQRTCVACRQTKDKKQLVRYVVAPDGAVLVDYRQRLPGRGAYTCIATQCLLDAVKKNSFQRCFKGRYRSVDPVALTQQLIMAVEHKISSLIGMSRKSGQFIAGSNSVIAALKKESSFALIIIATDISVAIGRKIETLALRGDIYIAHLYDKQKIGQLLGKEERSVIAVQTGLLADSLLNELHMYRQLVREN
ncbi:MAG: DUF448 domain-containing protein [Desulfuromusa sp.]|jgi:predicted RNA-binding protein YlxR (DUF448 family)|nr:DUF448 domain-containing protein [Desulfuromusa sp.]